MSRNVIAALAIASATLLLTACAPGAHQSGARSGSPDASGASVTASPHPTPTTSPPVAALATSPGDELLTFTGTASSANGSVVALSMTVHSPVAWNSAAGTSTLAALAGASRAGVGPDLLDPAWDASHGVSLAVVDYNVRMTAGTWVVGQNIVPDLGPDQSEVPASTSGLVLDPTRWVVGGPGSGHFVVAFPNFTGTTPDPSAWGDQVQFYGWETGVANYNDPNAYQLSDCHLTLTPLGERPATVPERWYTPDASYCSAGSIDAE
jgi:hypothetical protein